MVFAIYLIASSPLNTFSCWKGENGAFGGSFFSDTLLGDLTVVGFSGIPRFTLLLNPLVWVFEALMLGDFGTFRGFGGNWPLF